MGRPPDHGQHGSITYRSWRSMRNRCLNRQATQYARYGGRGITICKEWDSFTQFYKDMGERPSPAYTLDRIETNGSYEAANCRWATYRQQLNNKRNNTIIEYKGKLMTVSEARAIATVKVAKSTITGRLSRGWVPQLAIDTPVIIGTNQWR